MQVALHSLPLQLSVAWSQLALAASQVRNERPLELYIVAPSQLCGALQATEQSYASGQNTSVFRQLDAPAQVSEQAKPVGQLITPPSHWLAAQLMVQVLLAQPPLHIGGHWPPGGAGPAPHCTQRPRPSHWLPPISVQAVPALA